MSSVINVAPLGDIVVAVGKDEAQKLLRVSKVLLRIASPVFEAMLGPSFKEGRSTYDASTPLELPEDDPSATTNLCQILHWNSKCVNTTESDWLQKLAVVCDKYGCAQKLREYFQVKMTSYNFSSIDEFIMWAIVGDEKKFWELSEQILRTPQSQVEAACHKDLLHILPPTMLSDMKAYRYEARRVYSETAQKPIMSMYAYTASASPSIDTLCICLQNRLAGYYKALVNGSIVTRNITDDTTLPDMREYLTNNFGTPSMFNLTGNELDKQKCRKPCLACNWSAARAISEAIRDIEMGIAGQCKMCFKCFKRGHFALVKECKEHGSAGDAQLNPTASGSAASASPTFGQTVSTLTTHATTLA